MCVLSFLPGYGSSFIASIKQLVRLGPAYKYFDTTCSPVTVLPH